jgi:uncharacterized protein (TIGR02118 family)
MIKLVTCLKRRPEMPPEAFQQYWRTTHAGIVRPLPGIRKYVQSHTLLSCYRQGKPLYDGIAEIWVDDMNTVRGFQNTPELRNIQKDEPNFFIVDASPSIITEEHEMKAGPEGEGLVKQVDFVKRKTRISSQGLSRLLDQSPWPLNSQNSGHPPLHSKPYSTFGVPAPPATGLRWPGKYLV